MQVAMAEKAYEEILNQLLSKKLRPGDLIDRRQIANDLDVSLMPVSEAVKRLEYEGLLEAMPRRGTRVPVPDREDILAQMVVREALECQAARMVAGPEVQNAAEELLTLAHQADSQTASDLDRIRMDISYHTAVVELADCPALTAHFRRVTNLWLFYRRGLIACEQSAPIDSHVELFQDLCCMDANAAEARMRQHMRAGREQLLGKA